MAFPFIFESTFEQGSNAEWDTETDNDGALDFPSYRTLSGQGLEPFSGAYCLRLISGLGTNDATLTEGDIDIGAGVTRYARFNLLFKTGFTATANDTVHLLELQQAGGTIEATFGFRVVAATNVINLGIGETVPTSFTAASIQRGVWYTVELAVTCDSGAGNDGTIDLYLTQWPQAAAGAVAATQVATLDQGAIAQGVLGLQGHLATTTGTILIDNFVFDDARIYPQSARYPETPLLTKSAHAFVGPGKIEGLTLLSGGAADNILSVYDTDLADTTRPLVAELSNSIAAETVDRITPVNINRGAYCVLTGTNPRALVKIEHAPHGAGAIRSLGSKKW